MSETKNRTELKSFFKANLIPSEEHFASLIDAGLNQADDRVRTAPGEPLQVEAAGGAGTARPALSLYALLEDPSPAWTLDIQPQGLIGGKPGVANGLSLAQGGTLHQLFLKAGTERRMGMGTLEPEGTLHVIPHAPNTSAAYTDQQNNLSLVLGNGTGAAGTLKLQGGAANDFGFVRATQGALRLDATGAAYVINADAGVKSTKEASVQIIGGNGQEAIRLQTNGDSFYKTGRVGIGTDKPGNPLHVHSTTNDQAPLRFSSNAGWVEGRIPNADQAEWNTSAAHFAFNRPLRTTELEAPGGNNLRLAAGNTSLTFLASAHYTGLNWQPEAALSIGGYGKVNAPNAAMHITPDVILFGGRNADMEGNSAQISAGLHAPNSLNIVGMGKTGPERKIDLYADGGLKLHGFVANPTDMNGGFRIGDNTFSDHKLYSLKFGKDDTNQTGLGTFPALRGPAEMKRNGMAFHVKNDMGFAWFTTGWSPLLSIDASSKRAHFHGNLTTGSSLGLGTDLPKARISIGHDAVGNHQAWMNVGTYMTENTDYMYVGLKNEGSNRSDAVISWGDNTNDSLRLIFGPYQKSPQEVARFTSAGQLGIGTTSPTNTLHLGGHGANKGLRIGSYAFYGHTSYGAQMYQSNNAYLSYSEYADGTAKENRFRPIHKPGTGLVAIGGGGSGNMNYYGIAWNNSDAEKVLPRDFTHVLHIGTNGRVGVGTSAPGANLDVPGHTILNELTVNKLFRKVWHIGGNGPNDETDFGRINSRTLTFTKWRSDTALKITWIDNLRVQGPNPSHGRWEIKIDGNRIPHNPLVYDMYLSPGDGNHPNLHMPTTIGGMAKSIAAGTHTLTVWVGDVPSHAHVGGKNRYTGWDNSYWSIEVEEVYLH